VSKHGGVLAEVFLYTKRRPIGSHGGCAMLESTGRSRRILQREYRFTPREILLRVGGVAVEKRAHHPWAQAASMYCREHHRLVMDGRGGVEVLSPGEIMLLHKDLPKFEGLNAYRVSDPGGTTVCHLHQNGDISVFSYRRAPVPTWEIVGGGLIEAAPLRGFILPRAELGSQVDAAAPFWMSLGDVEQDTLSRAPSKRQEIIAVEKAIYPGFRTLLRKLRIPFSAAPALGGLNMLDERTSVRASEFAIPLRTAWTLAAFGRKRSDRIHEIHGLNVLQQCGKAQYWDEAREIAASTFPMCRVMTLEQALSVGIDPEEFAVAPTVMEAAMSATLTAQRKLIQLHGPDPDVFARPTSRPEALHTLLESMRDGTVEAPHSVDPRLAARALAPHLRAFSNALVSSSDRSTDGLPESLSQRASPSRGAALAPMSVEIVGGGGSPRRGSPTREGQFSLGSQVDRSGPHVPTDAVPCRALLAQTPSPRRRTVPLQSQVATPDSGQSSVWPENPGHGKVFSSPGAASSLSRASSLRQYLSSTIAGPLPAGEDSSSWELLQIPERLRTSKEAAPKASFAPTTRRRERAALVRRVKGMYSSTEWSFIARMNNVRNRDDLDEGEHSCAHALLANHATEQSAQRRRGLPTASLAGGGASSAAPPTEVGEAEDSDVRLPGIPFAARPVRDRGTKRLPRNKNGTIRKQRFISIYGYAKRLGLAISKLQARVKPTRWFLEDQPRDSLLTNRQLTDDERTELLARPAVMRQGSGVLMLPGLRNTLACDAHNYRCFAYPEGFTNSDVIQAMRDLGAGRITKLPVRDALEAVGSRPCSEAFTAVYRACAVSCLGECPMVRLTWDSQVGLVAQSESELALSGPLFNSPDHPQRARSPDRGSTSSVFSAML
jgi:hypothetical protein